MPLPDGFGCGLDGIAILSDEETRSISAENPDGSRGGGARARPGDDPHCVQENRVHLGRGWKVRPCIKLQPRTVTTVADIAGPGTIRHIWMTFGTAGCENAHCLHAVLRFYWDEEKTPSIEVPIGEFFANGHGLSYNVNSMPVVVAPRSGMNCYWPMPFRKRARVTIENPLAKEELFFYQISYSLGPVPPNAATFHSQWRRSVTRRERPEHVLVDGIRGRGHYVGTFIAWNQLSAGWWGEGESKFFIDGDTEFPTICTTGTEDYFGGSCAFYHPCIEVTETYSTPFLGYPLCRREPGGPQRHALYRWHIPDPIRFRHDLKVSIQALGHWPEAGQQPLTDDIAGTVFWYQEEPHAPFPELPPLQERFFR